MKDFVITRTFDASREMVWNAWTTPEMKKKWWGPKGFSSPVCTIDLRVGGKYLSCMRGEEGIPSDMIGKDFWSAGQYTEIVPTERIVSTDYFSNDQGEYMSPNDYGMSPNFPLENVVTTTFAEVDGKTTVTILYSVAPLAYEAMVQVQMREGWESSLDKLAAIL